MLPLGILPRATPAPQLHTAGAGPGPCCHAARSRCSAAHLSGVALSLCGQVPACLPAFSMRMLSASFDARLATHMHMVLRMLMLMLMRCAPRGITLLWSASLGLCCRQAVQAGCAACVRVGAMAASSRSRCRTPASSIHNDLRSLALRHHHCGTNRPASCHGCYSLSVSTWHEAGPIPSLASGTASSSSTCHGAHCHYVLGFSKAAISSVGSYTC